MKGFIPGDHCLLPQVGHLIFQKELVSAMKLTVPFYYSIVVACRAATRWCEKVEVEVRGTDSLRSRSTDLSRCRRMAPVDLARRRKEHGSVSNEEGATCAYCQRAGMGSCEVEVQKTTTHPHPSPVGPSAQPMLAME